MSDQETVTSHDQVQFADGARRGYLVYFQCYQGKTLRPRALYDFLMNILIDTTHPSA